MATIVSKLDSVSAPSEAIVRAAQCLAEGGLVVFPTETVYGLAANAAHPEALQRLRDVKQRSADKPFTVHIGSRSHAQQFVPNLSGIGKRLIDKAWPGPLTLIFKVPDATSAPIFQKISPEHASAMYHEDTIGLRCPDHPVASQLLTLAGVPIVAASANPAGAPAPNDADEALATLDGLVDIVLDGGHSRYAQPSTIARVNDDGFEILREGILDARTLHKMTHLTFLLVCSGNTCRSPMAAGLLRKLLAERLDCSMEDLGKRNIYVASAGTGAFPGLPAAVPALSIMKNQGVNIENHASQPVTLELLHRADYIFTMTHNHRAQLLADLPGVEDRCRTLDQDDINDPIGGDETIYARCAEQIETALRKRLEEIPL